MAKSVLRGLPFIVLTALVVVLAGCGASADSQGSEDQASDEETSNEQTGNEGVATTPPPAPTGTFSGDVLPILEGNCARCHTGDGPGTGHVPMDTVGDVLANADLITAAVQDGVMPPWPASDDGISFRDDWSLTDAERATLLDWSSFRPEADLADDHPIVSSVGVRELDEVDLVISGEGSYDGTQYQPDEYRCFIYDPGFTEDTWVRGYNFVPDQTEVVHHAIGTRVPASGRAEAEALAAASDDGQGGWSCFGDSGVGGEDLFLGWAPGQGPTEFPDGSALRMDADDFIILQIHYHFEVEAPADRSTLQLDLVDGDAAGDLAEIEVVEFLAPAEIPCTTDETGPMCDRDAAMAEAIDKYGREGVLANLALGLCGQTPSDFAHMTSGIATSSCDLPARVNGTLVSILGHEHEIGQSFRMTINPGTPEEQVLLDIPKWDFDWQLNYYPTEEIEIRPSDTIRIECSWDRSLRDPDLEPAYVLWADGTDDEMCFATITVRTD